MRKSLPKREAHPNRKTLRLALLLGAVGLAGLTPATAQQNSTNCLVQQAAAAAVQRQIALIDAAKVNPSAYFNGPNSCVAGDLLRSFNLSNLIPDLSGFLTAGAQGIINGVIDAAKRQVCQILDQQLHDTIRSINTNMLGYQGTLSGDLFRQLNGSITPVTIPAINGIGGYNHVQNTAFGPAFNLTPTPPRPSMPVIISPPPNPAPVPPTGLPGTGLGGNFGGIFQ